MLLYKSLEKLCCEALKQRDDAERSEQAMQHWGHVEGKPCQPAAKPLLSPESSLGAGARSSGGCGRTAASQTSLREVFSSTRCLSFK